MADPIEEVRIYDLPDAADWDGFIPQDKPGGNTEKLSIAVVEEKLVVDTFLKQAAGDARYLKNDNPVFTGKAKGPYLVDELGRVSSIVSVYGWVSGIPQFAVTEGESFYILYGAPDPWDVHAGDIAVRRGTGWEYWTPPAGTLLRDRSGRFAYVSNPGFIGGFLVDGALAATNLAGVGDRVAVANEIGNLVPKTAADVRTIIAALAAANPAFTGRISGPDASLSEFGVLRVNAQNALYGAMYGVGVAPDETNHAMKLANDGSNTFLNALTSVGLTIANVAKFTITAAAATLAAGVSLVVGSLAGTGYRPLVASSTGAVESQTPAQFRDTIGIRKELKSYTALETGAETTAANANFNVFTAEFNRMGCPSYDYPELNPGWLFTLECKATVIIAGQFNGGVVQLSGGTNPPVSVTLPGLPYGSELYIRALFNRTADETMDYVLEVTQLNDFDSKPTIWWNRAGSAFYAGRDLFCTITPTTSTNFVGSVDFTTQRIDGLAV